MPKPPFLHAILRAVILVVAFALLQLVAGVIMAGLSGAWVAGLPAGWPESMAAVGVANLFAMGVVVAWVRRRDAISWGELLPWRVTQHDLWLPALLLVLGSGVVLSEIDNYFVTYLPNADYWLKDLEMDQMATEPFAMAVVTVLIAPLTEEALFRGVILRGLLATDRRWLAITFSGVLFAAAHVNPLHLISTSVFGVVLGWFYVRTRSLGLCFAAHALSNGCIALALVTGVDIPSLMPPRDVAAVQHLPWWLTLLGALTAVAGAVLFHRRAPPGLSRSQEASSVPAVAAATETGAIS
jgi:uncharacterized protein